MSSASIEDILGDIFDNPIITDLSEANESIAKNFGKLGNNIGQDLRYTTDGNGQFFIEDSSGDIKVNVNELNTLKLEGNFTDLFNNLGIDTGSLNSDIQDQINELTEKAKLNPYNSTNTNFTETKNTISDYQESKGIDPNPQSADDLQKQITDKGTGDTKSMFEKIKSGAKLGTFVVFTAGTIAGIADIYNEIKNHQKEMNGCWLVNNSDNTKCKIIEFSCEDQNSIPVNYNKCNLCTPQLFNTDHTCIDTNKNYNPFNCTIDSIKTISNPANTNLPLCGTQKGQCDCLLKSGVNPVCCSDDTNMCNSNTIFVPSGYFLKCVNVSWWEAFGDAVGSELNNITKNLFGPLGNIFNEIMEILGILIAVLVGLVILFYFGKFIFNRIRGNSKK